MMLCSIGLYELSSDARMSQGEKMKRSAPKLGIWIVAIAIVVALVVVALRQARTGAAGGSDASSVSTATNMPPAPPKPIVQERMADPAYVASLKALIDARQEKIVVMAPIRDEMRRLVEGAAAELRAEGVEPTEEAVQKRVQRRPEWAGLSARAKALQVELATIQDRTAKTVRTKMEEQYAARRDYAAAAGNISTGLHPRPADWQAQPLTNAITIVTEPVVVTNRPGSDVRQMPALPERKPVIMEKKPAAQPAP